MEEKKKKITSDILNTRKTFTYRQSSTQRDALQRVANMDLII